MAKKRFALKKIFFWVLLISLAFLGFLLLIIFFVKVPIGGKNTNLNITKFDIYHYCLHAGISVVYQSFFYYFALNLFYKMVLQKKEWPPYLLWSLLFLLVGFVYNGLSDWLGTSEQFRIVPDISIKIFSYTIANLLQLVVVGITVAITWQLDDKKHQLQRSRVLEQQKTQLEKEKMQANYLFLKAQINPHFLHNTLNFLYAKSLPYSDELSQGILTLSEIMRYSLNKEEDEEGKVLLTQEIEHVNNIIKIQQLRFGNALQVLLSIRGELEGLLILPFVLITIVENAFKHGELKNADHPVRLELDLCQEESAGQRPPGIRGSEIIRDDAVRQQRLHFLCINKKKTGPKELSTGIGLDNTRKRLELAYGENYTLYIKDQKELFTVDLSIIL